MYSSQYWPFIRCACSGWPITRKFNRFKTTTMKDTKPVVIGFVIGVIISIVIDGEAGKHIRDLI